MNKTVRIFGRIVAYPIQPARKLLDMENLQSSTEDRILQMDSCDENASEIEIETALARLNWILRQLKYGTLSPTYQAAPRGVARRRGNTQSISRHVRRQPPQFHS
jgi:hypothetical protein